MCQTAVQMIVPKSIIVSTNSDPWLRQLHAEKAARRAEKAEKNRKKNLQRKAERAAIACIVDTGMLRVPELLELYLEFKKKLIAEHLVKHPGCRHPAGHCRADIRAKNCVVTVLRDRHREGLPDLVNLFAARKRF